MVRLNTHTPRLAKLIRLERTSKGLQQKDVALITGAHPMAVSAWERGVAPVPVRYVRPLCECLRIPKQEFIGAYLADVGENLDEVLNAPITPGE